jgi:hypothetical protein
MNCTGPCNQGRKTCPCPLDCELAEPDTFPWEPSTIALAIVIVLAIGVLCVVLPMGPA